MELTLNERVYIVAEGASGVGWAAAECLVADRARAVLTGGRVSDVTDEGVTADSWPRRCPTSSPAVAKHVVHAVEACTLTPCCTCGSPRPTS